MILLRHGQSRFNEVYSVSRIDPGIEDPELTPTGRDQAADASERLAEHGLQRIVASPYTRTLQTAEIIADSLGLPVSIEPLVRERAAFACDVGSPASELSRRWPKYDFSDLAELWWPQITESESEVSERCNKFCRSAADLADWSRILVVTHWGFIRGLTGQELGNGHGVRFDPVRRDTGRL